MVLVMLRVAEWLNRKVHDRFREKSLGRTIKFVLDDSQLRPTSPSM